MVVPTSVALGVGLLRRRAAFVGGVLAELCECGELRSYALHGSGGVVRAVVDIEVMSSRALAADRPWLPILASK